ncbi:MAG: hypothetical protein HC767_12185 [Akkermansiaceae bacterium]|nr:hypothetical protein [Akkermansiaceae bacterium]
MILTILILIGIAVPSSRWVNGWQLGKKASEDLRAVYAAQRMFYFRQSISKSQSICCTTTTGTTNAQCSDFTVSASHLRRHYADHLTHLGRCSYD